LLKHSLGVSVRWSESDPAGIAFYPRFFEWFDVATASLFARMGEPWARIFPERRLLGVPVVEAGATFHAPVRYGDELTIECEVTDITDKTFRIDHRVYVGPTLCATGFERRAWVPRPGLPGERPRAGSLPDDIRRKLAG
jgi:YbgC/YbaW family acyl-CoA thioester hydrolase